MLFINNKYSNIYFNIIKAAQMRTSIVGYTEKHHIIPKSLNGTNKKENLVILTAREHFICHWLLTKMLVGDDLKKMNHAFWRMLVPGSNVQKRYKPNSHTYALLRKQYGSLRKGVVTPDSVKQKISNANKGRLLGKNNPMFGVAHTAESKKKMSDAKKGSISWNQGKHHSNETRMKLSASAKNRQQLECSHCGRVCGPSNYTRWHGDNCKHRLP